MSSFPCLLTPIRIGNLNIMNRFVMPPMDSGLPNADGTVNQKTIAYYAERAKGGFGLIIVEYCHVNPKGKPMPKTLGIYDDKFIPGLKELVEACHMYGAKVFLQLHHTGRAGSPLITGATLEGASAVACPVMRSIPRAMTTEEVYQLIEEFGDGAVRTKQAGFDGVEIHGGHGYLVHQFMSGHSNKRNDEFGGNFRSRMRFAELILKNIKKKCGEDFPVTIRVSGDENVNGGKPIQETRAGVKLLEEYGLNGVNVSVGNYASAIGAVSSNQVAPLHNIYAAEEIKKSVKIPVIGGGRVSDPYYAEDVIASGRADMVFFGRGCLADPELPNKTAAGKYDEIALCIACSQRCGLHLRNPNLGISCLINPFTGKEDELIIKETKDPKNVLVIGAGPAGLETAWVAAKRGHKVTVFEKNSLPGGQFNAAAMPPYKHELPSVIKYLVKMCEKYGAVIKYDTEATEENILAAKPDVVVLATGGVPLTPPIPGIDGKNVAQAVGVLSGKLLVEGNILIVGGGEVGLETADFLGERYNKVTVVEMLPVVAQGINQSVTRFMLNRLTSEYGVKIVTNTRVTKILDNGIECVRKFTDTEQARHKGGDFSGTRAVETAVESGENMQQEVLSGFNNIVIALGAKSYNPLEEKLTGKVPKVYVIGDALKPRTAVEAIEEGARTAVEI